MIEDQHILSNEFIRRGDPVFVKSALKIFSFLKQNYSFEMTGFAEAYETVIRCDKNNTRLQIVFSIPEAPFLNIQKEYNGKIKKSFKFKPKNKETMELIKEFNKQRDSLAFEVWHKKLQKGEFNQIIEDILHNLADEIKETEPWRTLEKLNTQ